MALTITKGMLWFGLSPNKPTLPDGYDWVEADGEWLFLCGPDGREWFLEDFGKLVRVGRWGDDKSAGIEGTHRLGAIYYDDRETMNLPICPTT